MRRRLIFASAAMAATVALAILPASTAASASASSARTDSSHSDVVRRPETIAGRPAGEAVPQVTRFRECSNLTTTWVDIDIVTASGVQDWCFGGTSNGSPWRFGTGYPYYISNLCAGNNRGTLSYWVGSVYHQLSFIPGGGTYRLPPNNRPISLTILGFSGNATCYS